MTQYIVAPGTSTGFVNGLLTGHAAFRRQGHRLYFTEDERRAFLAAAAKAPREVRTFCGTLHATGCRISEALALTSQQIDLSGRVVVFERSSCSRA